MSGDQMSGDQTRMEIICECVVGDQMRMEMKVRDQMSEIECPEIKCPEIK